jgi:rfaE bifunctional protein nucleotidyltransferase chain/domain
MPEKIIDLYELAKLCEAFRKNGKSVVHCHGCFDLMHPGHIKYFQASKKMGDILVVTLSPDKYVDKGPGRPVFPQSLRAESIAALECVDHVSINKWATAEETIRLLRPKYYVKGQEFENLEDRSGKVQKEYKAVQDIGSQMRFTHEIVFSSTQLLEKYFFIFKQDNH